MAWWRGLLYIDREYIGLVAQQGVVAAPFMLPCLVDQVNVVIAIDRGWPGLIVHDGVTRAGSNVSSSVDAQKGIATAVDVLVACPITHKGV
jgi:hypothetical protein